MIPADIIEARAREYLDYMAFEQAKTNHQRSQSLRRAWQKAKAALVAIEARYRKGVMRCVYSF